jgi:hypothetical protein
MSTDTVGRALAAALNYVPNRDELMAAVQHAEARHREDPDNDQRRAAYGVALFELGEARAAKAIELGLISGADRERIERDGPKRRAVIEQLRKLA